LPQVATGEAVHSPRGSGMPDPTGAHDPALPATLQAWQEPHAASEQHTLSTQLPLWHCGPAVQACPTAFRSPHAPLAPQVLGDAQCEGMVHVVRHAPAAASQTKGAQDCTSPGTQAPLPSQVGASTTLAPSTAQVWAPHGVLAGCLRQAPAPSHLPSKPQLIADSVRHVLRGSGVPAVTGAQAPSEPMTLHAWQGPQVMAWQQTPSVQLPLAHSEAARHAAPGGRSPHEPPTHTLGGEQSMSLPHAAKQVLPLQR
jgi:hypothetical protein